jgi:hypothetical protein
MGGMTKRGGAAEALKVFGGGFGDLPGRLSGFLGKGANFSEDCQGFARMSGFLRERRGEERMGARCARVLRRCARKSLYLKGR